VVVVLTWIQISRPAPERELNEGTGRHVNDVPVVHEVVMQIAPTKYAERVSSAVLNPKPAIVTDCTAVLGILTGLVEEI